MDRPHLPTCPTCDKAVDLDRPDARRWFPFCGERCKLVDLDRWLGGDYRIAGRPANPQELTGDQ